MIARSAYIQLRYSPVLLGRPWLGLLWLYARAAGGRAWPGWPALAAGAGAAGGLVPRRRRAGRLAAMSASFLPVLRLYRLGGWRAPVLPVIALLYAVMTADSARRHYAGRGGEWKGRTVPAGRRAQ